jgi:hypothetical protein
VAAIRDSFVDCGHCGGRLRFPIPLEDTKAFSYALLWGCRVSAQPVAARLGFRNAMKVIRYLRIMCARSGRD